MENNEKLTNDLINTKVLLTTLKGYEKLMNPEKREEIYKMIQNFSNIENTLIESEKIIDEEIKKFEDLQLNVLTKFNYIMNIFDEFIKKYNEEYNNAKTISIDDKKQINNNCDVDNQCSESCTCKETKSVEEFDKENLKKFLEEIVSKEEMKKILKMLNTLYVE